MERTLHSGELSRAVFAQAGAADDTEIRALLGSVPMNGAWRIGFGREPSFFACPAPAGDAEHTLVARRDGRLISVGSWSEREVWLRGKCETIGYLHGLRMVPGTAGPMCVLREGYASLAREIAGSQAVAWFTSIDAANTRARRVLESRASGLPRYLRIADYLTRVIPVSSRGPASPGGAAESIGELNGFLNREGARHDLALKWSEARWRVLARSGFTTDDVVVVRRKGRIAAAAGVWDQSAWKQVVVHQYPRWVARLRPVIGLGAACLGSPGLPPAGHAVPLAGVFPFAVAEGCGDVLGELWHGLAGVARRRGICWLALGLDASDPMWHHLRRIGISYRTILYWVCGAGFPDLLPALEEQIIRPECATL
jgi:hypothetical protein